MSAWFFLIPEWRGRIYLFSISAVFPYLVIYLLWAANQHRTDRIGVIDRNFFRTKSGFLDSPKKGRPGLLVKSLSFTLSPCCDFPLLAIWRNRLNRNTYKISRTKTPVNKVMSMLYNMVFQTPHRPSKIYLFLRRCIDIISAS